jgi:SPP1 family predicted phage head-tail adaptor
MKARKYTRRIEIFTTTEIDDGYGGSIASDVSLGSFWAEVKQNSAYRDNSIGMADIKNNWSFNVRANPVLMYNKDNLTILYHGEKRVVNDIRYNDELFRVLREINIVANGN